MALPSKLHAQPEIEWMTEPFANDVTGDIKTFSMATKQPESHTRDWAMEQGYAFLIEHLDLEFGVYMSSPFHINSRV
jgi:hypothetical protein